VWLYKHQQYYHHLGAQIFGRLVVHPQGMEVIASSCSLHIAKTRYFFWYRNVHLCARGGTYPDYSRVISTLAHSTCSFDGVAQPAIGEPYQTKHHTSIVKKESSCGTRSKRARCTLTGNRKNEPRRQASVTEKGTYDARFARRR
jgi:hypothetical protein